MKRDQPESPTRFFLDKFSNEDITSWKKKEEDLNAYIYGLFYYLEGLRTLHHQELCDALHTSTTIALDEKNWCRILDFQFSDSPLSPRGSLKKGGRFNIGCDLDVTRFPPFPALYLAEDEESARREKFGITSAANGLTPEELALRKPTSYSFVTTELKLDYIFDLTKATNLKAFAEVLSKFKLTEDLRLLAKKIGNKNPLIIRQASELKSSLLDPGWAHNPTQFNLPSNPQIFGRFLRDAGFSAILYPSTKAPTKKCLAVFVENISGTDSFVQLSDPPHPGVKHTRLCSETWKHLC